MANNSYKFDKLLETKLAPIDKFKENPDNPREIDKEAFKKLKNNIQSFTRMLALRPLVVDKDFYVLGGNMRLKACRDLGIKEIPYLLDADLTEEEKKQFIILDNVSFGKWEWDKLANEWEPVKLKDWGLDVWTADPDELTTEFSLADGEKQPFQQMTFTLADMQAEEIKGSLALMKASESFKESENFENDNKNGNALYQIVKEWEELKK